MRFLNWKDMRGGLMALGFAPRREQNRKELK